MNKKIQIIFMIIVLFPILAPIIYTIINNAIESNREYYCDSQEHTLKDKICSYEEELLAEYICEDGYKFNGEKCELENTVKAVQKWGCKDSEYVYDEKEKWCYKDGIKDIGKEPFNLYTCPDGYIKSNYSVEICVLKKDENKELYNKNVEYYCPEEYEMVTKSSWYLNKLPNIDNLDFTIKGDTIKVCLKSVSYNAKWK